MERLGFEYVAPGFALILMLFIGERRWNWLLLGGIAIPLEVCCWPSVFLTAR